MKTYDSYKDSGIQWIGEIPEHWKSTKLKYIGRLYSGLTGKSGDDFKQDDSPLNKPFIPFTNIANNEKINPLNLQFVIINEGDEQNKVMKNDLFFMMSSENYDDVGKSTILLNDLGEVYLNSFCKGFRISADNVNALFLNYLLLNHAYRRRLMVEANGFTRINLKMEKVNDFEIDLPPLPEQTAIANYLDNKTTETDQIIADKEALINLYEEEKKALINEAVTKGVTLTGVETSSPKLKPSGIDWLGDVPEHWEVKKLFYLFDKISSGTTPKSDEESYYLDGEINWLNTGDLNNSRITETSKKITKKAFDDHSALKIYPVGSIVIAMYGATIGKLGILDIETTTNQACCVLSDIKNTNTLFVFNCLLAGQDALINLSYGGGQPNISQDTLRNFRIPIPPLAEQAAIVHHIETETAIINDKINRIKQEIELLKEYRQALIFEAVTGKIRVH